jgi:hypothetical protein
VELPGDARENRAGSAALAPATRQGREPSLEQIAGVVLLSHVGAACLPALADVTQGRKHHLQHRSVDPQGGEGPVDRGLGARLVERRERGGQAGAQPLALAQLHRARWLGDPSGILPRPLILGPGKACRFGGGEAALLESEHPPDPRLVSRRVEPEAALAALGPQQPIALLPGTQQVGAHPEPDAQLPYAPARSIAVRRHA